MGDFTETESLVFMAKILRKRLRRLNVRQVAMNATHKTLKLRKGEPTKAFRMPGSMTRG